MNSSPILTALGLSKSFTNGQIITPILKSLDLRLYAGEFTLLIGPSGAGKSTLLAAISGLQRPDTGTVTVEGISLWGTKPGNEKDVCEFRLQYCGFIFQNVNLFSCLTARQQIVFLLEHNRISSGEAKGIAEHYLTEMGLNGKEDYLPNQLSGGEQQRVAIARTLAMKPKLIFADEPTSNLDRRNGEIIVDLLHHASREDGAMVLCVTHDERVHRVADRVIAIEDGVITDDHRH